MAYQRKYGVPVPEKNSPLSPNMGKHNSLVMSDHTGNNLLTTPTRSMFRRYSLANTVPTTPAGKQNSYYNTHTSTKIDCKSPGYSTRIVQYNEHQEKSPQSQRFKYDKLGVFPIVHFFKKDLPHLKRKGDEANQMNSSSLIKYNSPEHNLKLLERIIKSNPGNQSTPPKSESEGNPKSVLDALKEISRKRIHPSGEEFILKEDGKRTLSDYDNESSSRKRLKPSSVENSVLVNSSSKRSSVDELMASNSSMDEYLSNKPKRGKFNENTNSQLKITSVPVKSVDVETQTLPEATPVPKAMDVEKPVNEGVDLNNSQREKKVKKTSPVKIFDETPLEAMRKNRLTVLMGSLTSNKTQSPKADDTLKSGDKFTPTKPLVSILSGPTKSPQKSNKHVTFDIPETVDSTVTVSGTDVITALSNSSAPKSGDGLHIVTKTSAAMIMPIVSASISESVARHKVAPEVAHEAPSLSSQSDVAIVSPIQAPTPSVIKFNMPSPSHLTVATTSPGIHTNFGINSNPKLEQPSVENNKRNDGFGETSNKPAVENSLNKTITTSTSSTGGFAHNAGFKFELTESQANTERKPIPTFSFMAPSASASTTVESSSVATTKSSLPSFTIPSTSSNQGTISAFNSSISKPSNMPSFSSNFTGMASTPGSNAFSQSTVAKNPLLSNFGTNNSTSNFVITSKANRTSPFSFGPNSTATTIGTPNFTSTVNSISSTSFPTSFVPPSSTLGAQNTNLSSAFDKPSGGFATSSSPLTNSVKPISKPLTTNTFSFGPASTNSFNKTSMFDNNVTNFGNDNLPKPTITQNTASLFSTTTSSFGTNNSTTPSTNVFGKMGNNNVFGNSNAFATQIQSFGSTTLTNGGNGTFGQNQNTGFGGDHNKDAKNNSTPSFRTPYNTGFGISTNASGFSSNVASFSTAPTTFASSGNFASTNNAFSSTFRTAPFDKSAVVTEATNAEVAPFGTTTSIFGSNNFSASSQVSNNFPANSQVSNNFPANAQVSSNFPANPQASQNNVFTFGGNTSSKPAVFSFGASEPPKASFSFQADNNANAFSPSNKSFGTMASTFNAMSGPFNVQPNGTTMFNIGTGGSSTVNRSRTQHKAKRRT